MKHPLNFAEIEFLLKCVSTKEGDSIPQNLNWDYMLKLAGAHKIEGLLYSYLKRSNAEVPAQILSRLAKKYHAIGLVNLRHYEMLKKILSACNKAGVEVILLKGAALAEKVFENPALRMMDDIDLLIKKRNLPQIEKILSKLGFTLNKAVNNSHKLVVSFGNEIAYISSERVSLDVHWDLTLKSYPFQFDEEKIWDRAQQTEIAGVQTLILSPDDQLLHLCFHNAFHHCFSPWLRGLADVAAIINKNINTFNWDRLTDNAIEYNIAPSVFATLYLAQKVIPLDIPCLSLNRLKGHCSKSLLLWLDNQITESLIFQAPFIETLVYLRLITGFRNKWGYIKSIIFPSKSELVAMNSFDPDSCRPYFTNLLKLQKNHLRKLISKLTGSKCSIQIIN